MKLSFLVTLSFFGLVSFSSVEANENTLCKKLEKSVSLKQVNGEKFSLAALPVVKSCQLYPTGSLLKDALIDFRANHTDEEYWNFAFKNVAQRFAVLSDIALSGEAPTGKSGQSYLSQNYTLFATGLEISTIRSLVKKASIESGIESLNADTIYANRAKHLQNINVMMEAMCAIGSCDR